MAAASLLLAGLRTGYLSCRFGMVLNGPPWVIFFGLYATLFIKQLF
jgi:hypothetical protein